MKVSVVGAAGYVGGELVRLALGHPELDVVEVTSRRYAGRSVGAAHPNLHHVQNLRFTEPGPGRLQHVDVAFTAVPIGEFAQIQDEVSAAADIIVDLGPDNRSPTSSIGADYITGLPEIYRRDLMTAKRISVPGCMATAASVAIAPLAKAALIDGEVTVDARTGSSGSGLAPTAASHHPERQHAMRVYRAIGHRHVPEIERMIGVRTRMTVTAVPLVRGVQVVCQVSATRPVTTADLWDIYREQYRDEPFVRVVARRSGVHRLPDPQFLVGSNFVDVGFEVDPRGDHIVVVAAVDNLVKGAAGGAVQSLNVAAGIDESAGLTFPGLHPA